MDSGLSLDVTKARDVTVPKTVSIFCISDLHLEMYEDPGKVYAALKEWPNADILVLAGDIGNPTTGYKRYLNFMQKCKDKYTHVVFVAGNHEYYGCECDQERTRGFLREIAKESGAVFLHRDSVLIEGVRIIGATLWSIISKKSSDLINDFKKSVFPSFIDYNREFVYDYDYLKAEIGKYKDSGPVVVVTHHLPSRRMIHQKFRTFEGNDAFATPVTEELSLRHVPYWFCGHTHEHISSKEMKTLIYANPMGYPGEFRDTHVQFKTHVIAL